MQKKKIICEEKKARDRVVWRLKRRRDEKKIALLTI